MTSRSTAPRARGSSSGTASDRPTSVLDMPKALDPSIRQEARRLREAGRSLNEIRDELGIGYSTVHRFTRGVRPDLERSAEDREKIRAAKRERHEEWKRTARRGPCGAPG